MQGGSLVANVPSFLGGGVGNEAFLSLHSVCTFPIFHALPCTCELCLNTLFFSSFPQGRDAVSDPSVTAPKKHLFVHCSLPLTHHSCLLVLTETMAHAFLQIFSIVLIWNLLDSFQRHIPQLTYKHPEAYRPHSTALDCSEPHTSKPSFCPVWLPL